MRMRRVSARLLERKRQEAETILDDTCVIKQRMMTDDGQGGWAASYGTTRETLSCRIGPTRRSSAEYALAGREASTTPWTVFLPHDTTVTTTDRIVVNSRTLEILAVLHRGARAVITRVDCIEVL